jgi:FkbM family methyltransferase
MNLNKIYIKLLSLIVNIIDSNNKYKIINFFKARLKSDEVCIIDVGAHKGETIDLFYKNFNILKILAFEANPSIYKVLEKKILKKYSHKVKLFNCGIGDVITKKILSIFNDSSSSTYNDIDKQSEYYQRKKRFLTPFQFNKSPLQTELVTQIFPLSHFSEINKLKKIDVLKIDTEGYEYNILKGVNPNHFKKIKYIYFEHHYDLMIKKNYTYADIKKLLNDNNFYLSLKIKMNFRKTFEYVYENKK